MSDTIDAPQAEASAPEIDAADDLAAAIGAAFDQHSSDTDTEAAPTRDERGRFARAATDEAPEPEADPEPAEQEAPTDGQQAQAAPETRPALPPEVDRLQQVLKRHEPLYAARGVQPEQALDALFNAQRVLEERPYEAIQVLARQYGVDLSRFAPQQPAPQYEQAAQSADPAYQAAMARIDRLEQLLTSQQQQAVQSQTAQVQRTIDEFAADPKHTHFRAVEPIMAALISGGQAKGLEQAYEMACRAHPDISKAISAAEAEAREKAAAEARRAAAAQAKAKAVSVRGSPTVNGFAKAPDSIEAALNAAWDGRLN